MDALLQNHNTYIVYQSNFSTYRPCGWDLCAKQELWLQHSNIFWNLTKLA